MYKNKFVVTFFICYRNNDNRTPLDLAVENGHISIVEILCKAISEISEDIMETYVNPDPKDRDPLLHLAIGGNHLSVVKYLLEHTRADLMLKDKEGVTPIEESINQGRK